MLIIWSTVFGILIFFGLVLVTLLLGAAGSRAEKEILARTEAERRAGLTEDGTSSTPHANLNRYMEA